MNAGRVADGIASRRLTNLSRVQVPGAPTSLIDFETLRRHLCMWLALGALPEAISSAALTL